MSEPVEPDDRASRLRKVTYEFLSRRDKGESLSVEVFCRSHSDLMPELAEKLQSGLNRLRFVDEIKQAEQALKPDESEVRFQHPFPSIRGYQVQSEISGGGQGTVFKATQASTGRAVAIKVVDSITSRQYHRFEREVQSLAKLSHPGIVGVIDRGRTSSGALYLAMEFVAGSDLDAWVDRVRSKPDAKIKIVGLFIQIAKALEVAHQAAITHRDLKPSNIRVSPDGHPKIIDFGLSHNHGLGQMIHLTVTGNILGSVPWTSPEQASGAVRDLGPTSDVYSLGIMLYQALTGRFPYPVDGPLHETTRHICITPPVVPNRKSRLAIAVDSALWDILKRTLAKEPSGRFQSAAELGDALQAYLEGRWKVSANSRRLRNIVAGGTMSIAALLFMGWFLVPNGPPRFEPLVVKRPSFTNSLGMKMVKLPASPFWMGSGISERGRKEDEEMHRVVISSPFWIGATEVTREQFRKVMGYLPKEVTEGADDLPIDWVSWVEARQFCERLSSLEGKVYRLPSEAEWEYACRAGTMTAFAGLDNLDQIGWYDKNSGGVLHSVACRLPNNWGLYDMAGNVAEWAEDGYTTYPGDRGTSPTPQGQSQYMRVVRGGSAIEEATSCRSAARSCNAKARQSRFVGFRVALNLPQQGQNPSTAPHF